MNHKIGFICLFLIFVYCLSAVCAADLNETTDIDLKTNDDIDIDVSSVDDSTDDLSVDNSCVSEDSSDSQSLDDNSSDVSAASDVLNDVVANDANVDNANHHNSKNVTKNGLFVKSDNGTKPFMYPNFPVLKSSVPIKHCNVSCDKNMTKHHSMIKDLKKQLTILKIKEAAVKVVLAFLVAENMFHHFKCNTSGNHTGHVKHCNVSCDKNMTKHHSMIKDLKKQLAILKIKEAAVKVVLGFLVAKNIFNHIKTSFGNHTVPMHKHTKSCVPMKNCNVSCDKNMTKHHGIVKDLKKQLAILKIKETAVKVVLGFLVAKNIFNHIKTSFGNHTVNMKHCNVSHEKNMTKHHGIVKDLKKQLIILKFKETAVKVALGFLFAKNIFNHIKFNKTFSCNHTVPMMHKHAKCCVPMKHCNVSCGENMTKYHCIVKNLKKQLTIFKIQEIPIKVALGFLFAKTIFNHIKFNKTSFCNHTDSVKHCNVSCDKNMSKHHSMIKDLKKQLTILKIKETAVKVGLAILIAKNIFNHIKTSFCNHTVPVKHCNVSCDKNMTKHISVVKRIAFPPFIWNKTWNRTVPVKHCNVSCDKSIMSKHLIVKRIAFPPFIWNKTSGNHTVPVKHCNVSCDKSIMSEDLIVKRMTFSFYKWNKAWNHTVPIYQCKALI